MRSSPATTSGFSVDAAGELRDTAAPGAGSRTGRAPCGCRGSPAPGAARAAACRTAGRRPRRAAPRRRRAPARASRRAAAAPRRRSRRRRSARSRSRSAVLRARSAASTLTASATISGPMPSPGRIAIFMRVRPRSRALRAVHREQPGRADRCAALERANLVGVLQREADLVEAVEQAVLAERLDVEANAIAPSGVATVCRSRSIVSLNPGKRGDFVEQPVDLDARAARSAAGRS